MTPTHPWAGLRVDDNGRALCSAKRSNGEQCNAAAVSGMRVCYKHGGASPQAKKKAAIRLAELVNPAVATLAREMVQADSSADRQRAANSILDRAGVPRVTKEISADDSRTILLTRLREIRQERQDGEAVEHTREQVTEQITYPLDAPETPDAHDTDEGDS